jgi:hypothetical protein
MVALWLLALQTPNLALLPTDVDFLNDVVCYQDKAYLLRAPIHLASSVTYAAEHEGALFFERNEPNVGLLKPNPRRSGLYRFDPGAEKPVALMEFAERKTTFGGVFSGRVLGLTVQVRADEQGQAVGTVHLLRYSLKDRRGDSLALPFPSAEAYLEGTVTSPYLSMGTENRSYLTRMDGKGWIAEGEGFWTSTDGSVYRRTMVGNTLVSERMDPKTGIFSKAEITDWSANGQWEFSTARRLRVVPSESAEPVLAPDWKVSRESRSSGISPSTVNRKEAWVVTMDPKGPNRVAVSWDTNEVFRVKNAGVAYIEKGHLFFRPMMTMDRNQFERLASLMEAAALTRNAKQMSIAIQLYAADNDDNFPPAAGFQDALMPYVKNSDTFLGFEFTPPNGVTNINKVADPANTPIGRIQGRFGTAVAMADGSVRWVKNP